MSVFTLTKSAKTLSKKVALIISCQYSLHATLGENETKVKLTLKINHHKVITEPLKHKIILTLTIRKYQSEE